MSPCLLVDADELDDALQTGVIDADLHTLAWREARQLQTIIQADAFALLSLTDSHRLQLLQWVADG